MGDTPVCSTPVCEQDVFRSFNASCLWIRPVGSDRGNLMIKTKEWGESCQYGRIFPRHTEGVLFSVGLKKKNLPVSKYYWNYFIAIRKWIGYNYQLLSKVRSNYFFAMYLAFPDVVQVFMLINFGSKAGVKCNFTILLLICSDLPYASI
jgi:hypothetical protein